MYATNFLTESGILNELTGMSVMLETDVEKIFGTFDAWYITDGMFFIFIDDTEYYLGNLINIHKTGRVIEIKGSEAIAYIGPRPVIYKLYEVD